MTKEKPTKTHLKPKKRVLNKFTFLPSFYDAVEKLPENKKAEMYKIIIRYGVAGIAPNTEDDTLQFGFSLIKPIIDKSINYLKKQKANGTRGGRPQKSTNPTQTQDQSQLKPNDNPSSNPKKTQSISQPEPKKDLQKPKKNRDSESDSDRDSDSD
ncbi:hypothetical protein IJJ08_01850, partial [bacterium]|nr:hypothetical protein [bacterium]